MKPFVVGDCEISSISRKEFKKILEEATKTWHFEKTNGGVKPVKGRYDPTNPLHVRKNNVIRSK